MPRITLFSIILYVISVAGTSAAPAIQGSLAIELSNGTIAGDVCIENRPEDANVTFVLNQGFNIKKIHNGDGAPLKYSGYYGGEIQGEARVYTLEILDSKQPLCVEYIGAFPVYLKQEAYRDWKGRIAFNDHAVRAAEQSAFLPFPYNAEAQKRYDNVSLNLSIACDSCKTMYLSGFGPKQEKYFQFNSATPRPPLLYAGDFKVTTRDGVSIIDSDIDKEQVESLLTASAKIITLYEEYLELGYQDDPAYLEFDPVQNFDEGSNWGFVTWPTIAYGNINLGFLARGLTSPDPQYDWMTRFVAHEFAHYYFGSQNLPTGPFRFFFVESTAEFMSLNALRELRGEQAFENRRSALAKTVLEQQTPFSILSDVTNADQITNEWRYAYGPLLLVSLEDRIGPQLMRDVMRKMAEAIPTPESWGQLTEVFLSAGVPNDKFQKWVDECVTLPANESCIKGYYQAE